MGLFDDLPSAKRPAEAAPPAPDPEPKRAKTEPAPAPAFAPAPADHVAALERIATHIVNPAKFKKAAALAAGDSDEDTKSPEQGVKEEGDDDPSK